MAKQLRSQTLGAAGARREGKGVTPVAAMAPGQPGDAARCPRTHLHGRAPSGTGLACPGRACCHRGSTAWHGRAPSRRDSPAGAAGWSPAGRGGRSPAGPGPGPAMPCHDPRTLTWSWQSRYCRGSPVHGSSSVDLRPQRQRGGDGARPPRAALPAPCVPHGVIPHLRGQDAAEPPSCSRVGSDASPRGIGSGDHDVPHGGHILLELQPRRDVAGSGSPAALPDPFPSKIRLKFSQGVARCRGLAGTVRSRRQSCVVGCGCCGGCGGVGTPRGGHAAPSPTHRRHLRVRRATPSPQELEQELQGPQGPQVPRAGCRRGRAGAGGSGTRASVPRAGPCVEEGDGQRQGWARAAWGSRRAPRTPHLRRAAGAAQAKPGQEQQPPWLPAPAGAEIAEPHRPQGPGRPAAACPTSRHRRCRGGRATTVSPTGTPARGTEARRRQDETQRGGSPPPAAPAGDVGVWCHAATPESRTPSKARRVGAAEQATPRPAHVPHAAAGTGDDTAAAPTALRRGAGLGSLPAGTGPDLRGGAGTPRRSLIRIRPRHGGERDGG